MKSVLLHINRDSGQKSRLQAALDLVRAQEGHLTCVQVTPIQQYVAMDPFGGSFVLPANLEELRAEEGLFREQTEESLRSEERRVGKGGVSTRSIGWWPYHKKKKK